MYTITTLVVFVLFQLTAAQFSKGGGFVGLGRTLFTPTCCYACLSALWPLQLSCSTGGNGTAVSTSPDCHSSNIVYMQTLSYCMLQKCTSENIEIVDIEVCWNAVAGDGGPVRNYVDALPSPVPEIELPYNATGLHTTCVVGASLYRDNVDTILQYKSQETNQAAKSIIVVGAVAAFCLLSMLRFFKVACIPGIPLCPRWISTKLDKYLFVPALFGKRHQDPLPYGMGLVPRRSMTFWVILYVGINMAMCVVTTSTASTNTWYMPGLESFGYSANGLGSLCLANVALTITFSGKNNLLQYITGLSQTNLVTFHRWTGRVALLEAIGHSSIYLAKTDENGERFFLASAHVRFQNSNDLYWTFGLVALVIMIWIAALSVRIFREYWYEGFIVIHIVLAIAAVVTLWYHIDFRSNNMLDYKIWFYLAFGSWGLDRMIRAYRFLSLNYKYFTKSAPRAVVELLPGEEYIKVTVFTTKKISVTAGQYCNLYFPTMSLFTENHPFTIASWADGTMENDSIAATSSKIKDNDNMEASPTKLRGVSYNNAPSGAPPLMITRSTSRADSHKSHNSHKSQNSCQSHNSQTSQHSNNILDEDTYEVSPIQSALGSTAPSLISSPSIRSAPSIRSLQGQKKGSVGPIAVLPRIDDELSALRYSSTEPGPAPVVYTTHFRSHSHTGALGTPLPPIDTSMILAKPRKRAATFHVHIQDPILPIERWGATDHTSSPRAKLMKAPRPPKPITDEPSLLPIYDGQANGPNLTFLIHPESGLTKRLHDRLLSLPTSIDNPSITLPVLIEGPYGSPYIEPTLKQADTILAIAGGIGISDALSQLNAYLESFPPVPVNRTPTKSALSSVTSPIEKRREVSFGMARTEEEIRAAGKRTGYNAQRFVLVWAVHNCEARYGIESSGLLPPPHILRARNVEVIISCHEAKRTRAIKMMSKAKATMTTSDDMASLSIGHDDFRVDIKGYIEEEWRKLSEGRKWEREGIWDTDKRLAVVSCCPGPMADRVREVVGGVGEYGGQWTVGKGKGARVGLVEESWAV